MILYHETRIQNEVRRAVRIKKIKEIPSTPKVTDKLGTNVILKDHWGKGEEGSYKNPIQRVIKKIIKLPVRPNILVQDVGNIITIRVTIKGEIRTVSNMLSWLLYSL